MLEQANQLVTVLQDLVRCDAVALTTWDPFDESFDHQLLAGNGYSNELLEDILHSYASENPAFRLLRTQVRGPLRWSDLGRDWHIRFAATPIAERYLLPEGFHEGLTAFLQLPNGAHVGAIHMNWLKAYSATDGRREVVERFQPLLAGATNFLQSHRVVADEVFPDTHVAVFGSQGHRQIPGRDAGRILREDGPLTGLERTVTSTRNARYLWIDADGDLHRIQLVRCADETTLVAECPIASPYGLTPRELEVVDMITDGESNVAIAAILVVSPRTVSTHVEHILAKMGCGSRAQVAAIAVREGIRLWRAGDGHGG